MIIGPYESLGIGIGIMIIAILSYILGHRDGWADHVKFAYEVASE